MIAIAYWSDAAAHARWCATPVIDAWWRSDDRLNEGLGYFREIASPRVEHFETMLNTPDRFEGVGVVMGEVSGETAGARLLGVRCATASRSRRPMR